jgi:hypothetical protein
MFAARQAFSQASRRTFSSSARQVCLTPAIQWEMPLLVFGECVGMAMCILVELG